MTSRNRQLPKVTPTSWIDAKNPEIKGWKRSTIIRGENDKLHGKPYYLYYSPDGKRFRSLKQSRIYMLKCKTKEKENTIPPQQLKKPYNICMVSLAIKDLQDDNIQSIELTPGGGIHIRWNDF